MSQENVEVVLETFRRFKPNDLKDRAGLWHPEARATPAEGWPEPGPFVGRDAVVRQFERLFADWSEYGRITDAHFRWNREEALDAAGLAE